jgi:acetyl-CoA carboxylase carboxyltransferase component
MVFAPNDLWWEIFMSAVFFVVRATVSDPAKRKAFDKWYHRDADMNYAWPTAQIAVMGAKGAAEIIFRSDIGDTDKIAARTREYEDRFLSPFVAAERGYIDDVIMPHSTRRRIARALAMLRDKKVEVPVKKHDNLPL